MASEAKQRLISDIKLMKELKELIICEARAMFSAFQPASNLESPIYDVLISKKEVGSSYEYKARLILYTQPASFAEWKMLMANPYSCHSAVVAMADLLEDLYDRAEAATENIGDNDGYFP